MTKGDGFLWRTFPWYRWCWWRAYESRRGRRRGGWQSRWRTALVVGQGATRLLQGMWKRTLRLLLREPVHADVLLGNGSQVQAGVPPAYPPRCTPHKQRQQWHTSKYGKEHWKVIKRTSSLTYMELKGNKTCMSITFTVKVSFNTIFIEKKNTHGAYSNRMYTYI